MLRCVAFSSSRRSAGGLLPRRRRRLSEFCVEYGVIFLCEHVNVILLHVHPACHHVPDTSSEDHRKALVFVVRCVWGIGDASAEHGSM
ncbi:hypothetical protein EJB05_02536 [Eragrostis curvula]|uniref:Uncharacterized protein n=1 Tax=Eragrostis curvula TaxID=38414 RepID=A0A5J9WSB5_9POAL|nr:hypothetical protein EJB05_02536 [Eragrostis curvula]